MTVAAWCGRYIAADKQTTLGDHTVVSRKLFLDKKNLVALACAGNSGRVREFHEWVRRGRPLDCFPPFQRSGDALEVLLIDHGNAFFYGEGCIPIRIESKYHAIGSGSELAIGAMARGANAIEAVEIANAHSPSCGAGVDWAALGDWHPDDAKVLVRDPLLLEHHRDASGVLVRNPRPRGYGYRYRTWPQ